MMSEIQGPMPSPSTPRRYVIADARGQILMGLHATPSVAAANAVDGQQLIEVPAKGIDLNAHYVKGGTWESRPANPATISGTQLENLPVPCAIRVNTQTYQCSDATADISFDQPGVYKVVVSAWPYLDKEFTIENPAQ